MLQGILIVVAFLVVAALMMTKKIPTLLALPLMAVVICIIAGVPMFGKNADGAEIGWLTTVFEAGTVRMGSAIMATIFGAWLGQLMNKTGVTENIIKKSAELGGDRPLVVTLIMVVATAVLFTTLSGLGSIIMVGSIVLPILISVGVPAASAACIFLMAFTTGLACNIANWKSFASIFSLDIADIQGFEIYLMAATAIATLIMVIVEFKRNGIKFAFSAPVDNTKPTKQLTGVRGGLAMITPLIPIVLVAFLKVPVTPAFTVGIIWCLLFTSQSFSKAIFRHDCRILATKILVSDFYPLYGEASTQVSMACTRLCMFRNLLGKSFVTSGSVAACCDGFSGFSEKLTTHIFDLRPHKWVCLKRAPRNDLNSGEVTLTDPIA